MAECCCSATQVFNLDDPQVLKHAFAFNGLAVSFPCRKSRITLIAESQMQFVVRFQAVRNLQRILLVGVTIACLHPASIEAEDKAGSRQCGEIEHYNTQGFRFSRAELDGVDTSQSSKLRRCLQSGNTTAASAAFWKLLTLNVAQSVCRTSPECIASDIGVHGDSGGFADSSPIRVASKIAASSIALHLEMVSRSTPPEWWRRVLSETTFSVYDPYRGEEVRSRNRYPVLQPQHSEPVAWHRERG